jgi:hypothetical protein
MAATYTIITQYPDVETNGGQVARDIMRVGVETKVHGVYFELTYPRKGFTEAIVKPNAAGFTLQFENLFDIDGVEAVVWGEQLNAANQIEQTVTVFYTSTSGDSDNFVLVPFRQFTQTHVETLVAAGRKQLDAIEAI